jgi:hypothetical protein
MRSSQTRAAFAEEVYAGSDVFLFRFAQGIPPGLELIGEFDFPCHRRNITCEECIVKEFTSAAPATIGVFPQLRLQWKPGVLARLGG